MLAFKQHIPTHLIMVQAQQTLDRAQSAVTSAHSQLEEAEARQQELLRKRVRAVFIV